MSFSSIQNVESPIFDENTRQLLKNGVIDALVTGTKVVQIQLGEIICLIASCDFPDYWPNLIEALLSKISPSDFIINLSVLKTVHYIFKRYRSEMRSDELYSEINYVMARFGPALFQIYQGLDAVLRSANELPIDQLSILLQNAACANKIFYSLSYQDIPAFIEDNLSEFMRLILGLFNFSRPGLSSLSCSDEAGVPEKLIASVAKVAVLYATKYEEDFTMLPQFAEATWNVLTTKITPNPKDDKIASLCIRFLASIARQERHKDIFSPILTVLCQQIIVPNMEVLEADLEKFVDDPIEFIRQESETSGEDSHLSRSGASIALIRNLMDFHEISVTSILMEIVNHKLQSYCSNPASNWSHKIIAIRLFSAVGARGHAENYGVTKVNPLVNIHDFFEKNVKIDLHHEMLSAVPPLLKLEDMKFIINYRSQLSKSELAGILPRLLIFLEDKNYIVHTFAALSIERLLALRQQGEPIFTAVDLASMTGTLCFSILSLIFNNRSVNKMCENHFIVKTFMRVLELALASDVDRILSKFLDRLIWLFQEIAKNPVNPHFNYFFYECLVLFAIKTSLLSQFESKLVPVIFGLLQADQFDFYPYAFQILAALVEAQPALPDYCRSILPLISQPVLWSSSENVPALIRLIQACALKEPIAVSNLTDNFMAIARPLILSNVNDIHGFALLSVLFRIMPEDVMGKHLKNSLMLCLHRAQAHKTARFNVAFLSWFSYVIVETSLPEARAASLIIAVLEQIQGKIYQMIVKSLFLNAMEKHFEPMDKRLIIVAMSEILSCLAPTILASNEDQAFWFRLFEATLMLTSETSQLALHKCVEEHSGPTLMTFNRLIYVPRYKRFSKLLAIYDADALFIEKIKTVASILPSGAFTLMATGYLGDRAKIKLNQLMARFSVAF